MFVSFDKFEMAERPVLTLAYPQGKELGQLGAYQNLSYDVQLNSYSSLTFKYPYYCEDGVVSNLYDSIQSYMLIKAGSLGNFIVTSCQETNEGIERYLDITADSAEVQMCHRKINLLNGTYKFYDLLNPDDTLLGQIIKYIPAWSIGDVSADLMGKYRTFDVPDSTLYGFLMNEVSQTYECIFTFDTTNKTINAYTVDDITKDSDIFIGHENFLKSENIEEISDSLTNVMACYGGDGVNIASVNPLGSVYLYNFDHFKHMMSDSLRAALTRWEALYNSKREEYTGLLSQLKTKKVALVTAQANLTDAQGILEAQVGVQAAMIAGGTTESSEYAAVLNRISNAQSSIEQYGNEIVELQADIDGINNQQQTINNSLRLNTDGGIFSSEDLLELDNFKFESTHQDDNFIITGVMDVAAQQDMMEQLYEQCNRIIQQVSHPTYNITADAVNFLFIKELEPYLTTLYDAEKPETLKQLLAVKFHLEVAPDEWIEPVLLKFHINYDDPTDFSMEFSNRYRLNDSSWTYGDLIGDSVAATGNLSFDYESLKSWETHKNDLIDFANGSLDATRNKLVNNADNPTIVIDATGLRGSSPANNRGIWLTNDTLAFSDDNFQTVRTAVGLIPTTGGSSSYGVNAETLIGKAIFGSELTITNENNSMVMDASGLTINTSTNRIKLNPDDGILIQQKSGSSFVNQLYADASGNLVLAGNITANSGILGGFKLSADGIESQDGNIVLNANGTGKIGMITIGTSSTTFNGNIYAKNIQYGGTYGTISGGAITGGTIDSYQLAYGAVTAGEISSGAVTDAKIASGTITGGSINVSSVGSALADGYFNDLYATTATVNTLIANKISTYGLAVRSSGSAFSGNLIVDGSTTLKGGMVLGTGSSSSYIYAYDSSGVSHKFKYKATTVRNSAGTGTTTLYYLGTS